MFLLRTDKGNKYILKNDDMTKDRLVMLFAHLIERLCETKCVQYPVFVTKNGGWVEMLSKAKTLYELNYELSSHIHNCFPEDTVRCVRHDLFGQPLVHAYCLTYLVSVIAICRTWSYRTESWLILISLTCWITILN